MNLLKPLILHEAKTSGVGLTPTSRFFKPVLIIEAPLDLADAELLGAGWLFDSKGVVRPFDESVSLKLEIPGALVTLTGRSAIELNSEKVVKFKVKNEEKTGLRLKFRIHLPENEDQLVNTLRFLSNLNKDGYTIKVDPAQKSIPGLAEVPAAAAGVSHAYRYPDPDAESGHYPYDKAVKRPFTMDPLAMTLFTLQVADDMFISEFTGTWGKKDTGGNPMSAGSDEYRNSTLALEACATRAWEWLVSITPRGPKQVAAQEAGLEFLQDVNPPLARRDRKLGMLAEGSGKEAVQ